MASEPTRPDLTAWPHHELYRRVRDALAAVPAQFATEIFISGVLATDLHTLNSALGAAIEEQVVATLNAMRATWDPARSWGRPAQLDGVPVADPDPAVEPEPAALEVSASTWCSWPVHVRESLRAVTSWMKAPGVMRTEVVDGATAERVRDVAAQHGVAGLEEVGRG